MLPWIRLSPENPWYRDPMTVLTAVIAGSTFIYMLVSTLMWCAMIKSLRLTRKLFSIANRPYIGIEDIQSKTSSDSKSISVHIEVKNFGNLPAMGIEVMATPYTNGEAGDTKQAAMRSTVLYPAVSTPIIIKFRTASPENLELLFKITYKDIGKQDYYFEEKYRYDPDEEFFVGIEGEAK